MSRSAAERLQVWLDDYQASSTQNDESGHMATRAALAYLCDNARDSTDLGLAHDILKVLQRLSPDADSVAVSLLLPLMPQADALPEALDERHAPDVGVLLEQLRRLTHYGRSYLPDDHQRAEGLRRLLLALVADLRVVLIALAWQVARLYRVGREDQARRRSVAQETRLIHAPLANRLGVWQLKWELEDLAFRYLEPGTYQRIADLVAERHDDREAFIGDFIEQLKQELDKAGIAARVSGRAKHIYSIWRKMQRKGLDFHQLFDVRAVRVLTDSVADCYSVLGQVHTRWQPVPGEFDDYITNPKPNGYQSLHTAVSGPGGRVVEVQIRTHDMHRHAELGVAAHWRYKEGGPRDESLERRIGVMRQLLETSDGDVDDASLLESFENLTTEDRVYALTPRGEVMDLAAGATPLDFAYLVHTEVGHRCRGAKVNGRIVPLTTTLNNGDRVEILTAREPRPSRDWLSPRLGYIRTARARAKVRAWFRQADHDDNLASGRQAIENEFRRLDLGLDELDQVLGGFNFRRPDELFVAVGRGDFTAIQVAQAVERAKAPPEDRLADAIPVRRPRHEPTLEKGVRIEGVGSLMYQLARCCQPVPGDEISGYITRGRGVSIHRRDCRQLLNLQRNQPERILEVSWAGSEAARYPARLHIQAFSRQGLIKDISTLLAHENINVSAIQASEDERSGEVEIDMTVQVLDFDQLVTLLSRLQTIPNVTSARRRR